MTTTVTFSPSPLAFGDVDPSVSTVKQLTITLSAPIAQVTTVATTGTGLSITPSSIPALQTTGVFTVTFAAPVAAGPATGTVHVAAGQVTATVAVSAEVVELDGGQVIEKHLLFEVPNYGDTTFQKPSDASAVAGERLTSFLRLGKFDYSSEPIRAQELLKLIPQVTSATDPIGTAATTAIFTDNTLPKGTIFADDIRTRPQDTKTLPTADDPEHKLTKGGREAESKRLYSRGGWRDHSDGNRISTTYGDKVEVVRGNYKMIVMGRQTDTGQAMGWDAAGGHIQDFAPGTMPGASQFLEWIDDPRYHQPDFKTDATTRNPIPRGDNPALFLTNPTPAQKGVWLLVNTTENVYEYARNAGNFREEVWGDVNEAYVGSENPPASGAFGLGHADGTAGHTPPERLPGRHYDFPYTSATRATPPWNVDNTGMVRSNPHIIEKTWAAQIDSHTGSGACPVPKITEKTFADKTYSYTGSSDHPIAEAYDETHATTITEKTYAGHQHAFAQVGAITKVTVAGAIASNANVAGTIAEATNATTMFSNTISGAIFEATTCLTHWEAHTSILHVGFELGIVIDLFFGAKFEFDLAGVIEASVFEHKELIPHEDKSSLVAIRNFLGYQNRILSSETTTVQYKRNALSNKLTALSTELGV